MTDKYKKEIENIDRRVYIGKTLKQLKDIGKKKGLLNVDNIIKEIKTC